MFLWAGEFSNKMEKIQGIKIAQQFRTENGSICNGVVIIDDENEKESLSSGEKQIFEKFLPLSEKSVKSHQDIPDDDIIEIKQRSDIKLYQCSDESGSLQVTEIKSGPLEQSDLNSMVRQS